MNTTPDDGPCVTLVASRGDQGIRSLVVSDKFLDVPVESDSRILFETEATLGSRTVLYQKWYWAGIIAESIIFAEEDVKGLSEDEIRREVLDSPLVNEDSQITFKHSQSGFVFVNFNFIYYEDKKDEWVEPEPLSPEEVREKKAHAEKYYGNKNNQEIERIKQIVAKRNTKPVNFRYECSHDG